MENPVEKFVTPGVLPTDYERELLVIAMEECAEVQQRISKMIRFGRDEVEPGQSLSNRVRLACEIGDLRAVLDKLQEANLTSADAEASAMRLKFAKLEKYMQFEQQATVVAG